MDMRRSCPSYEFKSSFWPLPGMMIIIVMVIVVLARSYSHNFTFLWYIQEIIIIMFEVHGINYHCNYCRQHF